MGALSPTVNLACDLLLMETKRIPNVVSLSRLHATLVNIVLYKQ